MTKIRCCGLNIVLASVNVHSYWLSKKLTIFICLLLLLFRASKCLIYVNWQLRNIHVRYLKYQLNALALRSMVSLSRVPASVSFFSKPRWFSFCGNSVVAENLLLWGSHWIYQLPGLEEAQGTCGLPESSGQILLQPQAPLAPFRLCLGVISGVCAEPVHST